MIKKQAESLNMTAITNFCELKFAIVARWSAVPEYQLLNVLKNLFQKSSDSTFCAFHKIFANKKCCFELEMRS